MKHKKFYLALSLLLGSFLSVTNLSGCAQNETLTFSLEKEVNDSAGGSVSLSKESGNVGEKVTVTITVNEGYKIESISFNGEVINKIETLFEIEPKEGRNILKVNFDKQGETPEPPDPEEDKFVIELSYNNELGTVAASKLEGKAGEEVTLTITPKENVIIEKIIINNEEVEVSTRKFVTKKGKNIVKVEFKEDTNIPPTPEKDTFNIELIYDETLGKVETSALTGEVGEKVTFTVSPNPNVTIDSILINNEGVDVSVREFTPVKGKNTIKVNFKVKEEPKPDWTIEVSHNEGGVATLESNEGFLGEKVELNIATEPDYEVNYILFNDVEVDKDTRIFTPVVGVNKIVVNFIEILSAPSIDEGFSLENEIPTEGYSDIISAKDLADKIVVIIKNKLPFDSIETGETLTHIFTVHPEFLDYVKTAKLSKDDFDKYGEFLINDTFIDIVRGEMGETPSEAIKKIASYLLSVVKNLTLEEFIRLVPLSLGLMFAAQTYLGHDKVSTSLSTPYSINSLRYHYDDNKYPEEVKTYLNDLSKASNIDELDFGKLFSSEFLKYLQVITDFLYKFFTKIEALSVDSETLFKHIDNIVSVLSSGGNYETLNINDVTKSINFLGEVLSDGFVDLEGFKLLLKHSVFLDKINNLLLGPMMQTNSPSIASLTVNVMERLNTIIDKPEASYRTIKFVGRVLKEATSDDVKFILDLLNGKVSPSVAFKFVNFSKLLIRTYTNLGREAKLVKEAFNEFIIQITKLNKEVFAGYDVNATGGVNLPFHLNFGHDSTKLDLTNLDIDLLISEIEKASKKDVEALTDEDDAYYNDFIEKNINQKITTETTLSKSYTFNYESTYYNVGDELKLSLTKVIDGNAEEIEIKKTQVTGFDTSSIGFKVMKYQIEGLGEINIPYQVGIKSEYFYLSKSQIEINDDLTTISITNQQGEEIATAANLIGLDLTKKGPQDVALKLENSYALGKVLVYSNEDLGYRVKFNNTLPSGVELDFALILKNQTFTETGYVRYGGEIYDINVTGKTFQIDTISRVDNRRETIMSFGNEGSFLINFEFKNPEGEFLTSKFEFNARKAADVETSIQSKNNDLQFYNFKGATRNDNVWLDFELTASYIFTNGNRFYYSFERGFMTSSFDNGLKNDTLSTEENDQVDTITHKDNLYTFRYTVYELTKEVLKGYYLETLDGSTIYKDKEVTQDNIVINKADIYYYKDLKNADRVALANKDELHPLYPSDKEFVLDTSKAGINEATILTDEETIVNYYVSETEKVTTNELLLFLLDSMPNDEDSFRVLIETRLNYVDPFTGETQSNYLSDEIIEFSFGDIKDKIVLETGTHEFKITFKEKEYVVSYIIPEVKDVPTTGEMIEINNEEIVYNFVAPEDGIYKIDFHQVILIDVISNGEIKNVIEGPYVSYIFLKEGTSCHFKTVLEHEVGFIGVSLVTDINELGGTEITPNKDFTYNKTKGEVNGDVMIRFSRFGHIFDFTLDANNSTVTQIDENIIRVEFKYFGHSISFETSEFVLVE